MLGLVLQPAPGTIDAMLHEQLARVLRAGILTVFHDSGHAVPGPNRRTPESLSLSLSLDFSVTPQVASQHSV